MYGHTMAAELPQESAGEPASRVAALFDAHYDRLYRLSRRLTSSTDDALDLVQETFLRAAGAPTVPAGAAQEEAWPSLSTARSWRRLSSDLLSIRSESSPETSPGQRRNGWPKGSAGGDPLHAFRLRARPPGAREWSTA